MSDLIRIVDAHAGGHPVRTIVDGVPASALSDSRAKQGRRTLDDRIAALRRAADHVRRAAVLPPRGHRDLLATLLLEPTTPGADAGVVFMNDSGYLPLSGTGLIAVATVAIERGLLHPASSTPGVLTLDTLAGSLTLRVHEASGARPRIDAVTLGMPPAYVHTPGHVIRIGTRTLRVDVAFGGAFYGMTDAESVGIPVQVDRLPELRRLGIDLSAAILATVDITHPALASAEFGGVVFTAPPRADGAHLRAVTVSPTGGVTWSPGVTAMAAVMSVLDAMALLPDATPFIQEGLSGATFSGTSVARTTVDGLPAIVCEIVGGAFITGEGTLILEPNDSFRHGTPVGG